ncbi:glycosyltransferase family 2 protein [Gordonia alkanivorans]|uniref:glycosyltransferase family 2 protein n=1 Tax=Gordonia alkanivorans TaxID=84096 RepID=UPI00244C14A1|nr:glycosyltransferase family 2 protein [Gordonia alkanivorans]MDH3017408.1 glycosyltransferase family 2 protein [Gordonia alkanivorans]MDH3042732.1 glycosyltransferase family 2 protein [Gordonia alkanivorans]
MNNYESIARLPVAKQDAASAPPNNTRASVLADAESSDHDCCLNVIIVNYFTAHLLKDCISKLQGTVTRVIVVDNSVNEDEFEALSSIAKEYGFVHIIQMPQNGGFGKGVNAGVESVISEHGAEGQVLWILNPDATDESGVAAGLLAEALKSYPEAILSPVILLPNKETVWYAGGRIDVEVGKYSHDFYLESKESLPKEAPYWTEYMCGASVFCNASVWSSLGGFREDLFMYCEDLELSIRAKERGVPMLVVPKVTIVHQVGAASKARSATSLSRLFYYYSSRNRVLVFLQPRGMAARPRIRTVGFLVHTLRMVLRPLVQEKGVSGVRKSFDVVRGTARGFSLVRTGVSPQ